MNFQGLHLGNKVKEKKRKGIKYTDLEELSLCADGIIVYIGTPKALQTFKTHK